MPSFDASRTSAAPLREPPAFDVEEHRARRERFLAEIGSGVAVIPAAPETIRSRDTAHRFRQDSDFYYLTGFREPEAVAVLTPHDGPHRFTLFVRPRDPEREVWDGPRTGIDGAREFYGADAAYPVSELKERLKGLVEPGDAVWHALGARPAMDALVMEIVAGFRLSRARSGKGPTDVRDPASVLDVMRRVKEPVELERIRRAAKVSAAAHRAAMAAARPGVGEWELEAVVDSAFRAADPYAAPAFATIVGSGANATTLHHVTNDRRIGEGELVLVDAGAEIAMYCADITRTFPASGRFTAGQRALYDVVLAAEEAAIAAVRAGAPFSDLHDATLRALVAGMVELGLLRGEVDGIIEREEHKRFYMHQTSHWIGLDVHDAGPYRAYGGEWVPMEPGMVLTIEPGLYVPGDAVEVPEEFRGLGVRIEDDVIVTADGPEVITRDVPVDPAEVEALVGSA